MGPPARGGENWVCLFQVIGTGSYLTTQGSKNRKVWVTGKFLGTTQQGRDKAEGRTFGGSCLHSLACTSVPSWLHLLLLHFPSFPPIAADSRVSSPFPMPPSYFRCSAFSCLNLISLPLQFSLSCIFHLSSDRNNEPPPLFIWSWFFSAEIAPLASHCLQDTVQAPCHSLIFSTAEPESWSFNWGFPSPKLQSTDELWIKCLRTSQLFLHKIKFPTHVDVPHHEPTCMGIQWQHLSDHI